jgi:hypothetical protein
MRDYSQFTATFWTGNTGKKLHGNPCAQVLAAYLLTGRHSNQIGLYYLPLAYAAHETGMGIDTVSQAMDTLSSLGFCWYDREAEMVWVVKMAQRQISRSPKAIAGAQRELKQCPETSLKRLFTELYGADLSRLHTVSIPYPEQQIPHPELLPRTRTRTEQEQEQEQKKIPTPAEPAPAVLAVVPKSKLERPKNEGFDAVVAVITDEYARTFPSTTQRPVSGSIVGKLLKLAGGDAERIRAPLRAFLETPFWADQGAPLASFVGKYDSWERAAAKGPAGAANGKGGRMPRAAATTHMDFAAEPSLEEQMKGWANG